MLMLTLDDAVKVAMRYSDMDEEILRSEFEQKCWISVGGKGMSDLIERRAAIDKINRIVEVNHLNPEFVWFTPLGVQQLIRDLPSVQPERKTGKWIDGKLDWHGIAMERYCSECGQLLTSAKTVHMNYCPNCGADMRGEQDG